MNDDPRVDHALVQTLDDATTGVRAVTNAGATDVPAAYAVQEALVARRLQRGESLVGWKLGFTSLAKMAQMGVSDVIVGRLTSGMEVRDGGAVDLGRFIHPRVELEIAYRLARDVDPAAPAEEALSAVDAVAPALEIIDSRYQDFRFTLADVIADNTSAAAFVIGSWTAIEAAGELGGRAVALTVDGQTAQNGSTDAILGHPLRALPALAEVARRQGMALRAGQVVLAGAATAAVALTPGAVVQAEVDGLGAVTVRAATADGR
ncbi:MAG TPA: fumarylacetoacetate hydrolase family protein [Geodermatophilus sp.]|nr:fumarylacetoacetate hydrolase family protein [Geodermatophilus sp.]